MKDLSEEVYKEKYLEGEEEELSEGVAVVEAMEKAREAFNKHFEKLGFDAAYFRLKLEVEFLDSDFQEALEKITWEDLH